MIRLPDETGLLPATVARSLLGAGARVESVAQAAVPYVSTSIATGGLRRVTGTADTPSGSRTWSVFVKTLQHPRHWAMLPTLPPEAAAEMCALFPWREELDTRALVLPVLPAGLRVPRLYDVVPLAEDRLEMWMEDVDADDTPWNLATYARCARLLARLAARRRPGTPAGTSPFPAGFAVRKSVALRAAGLAAALDDPALWARPLVADVVDASYRRDLRRYLEGLPALLDDLDVLPLAMPHGDAAPCNLLRPRGEPGTFVAIDWSFGCALPLGFDLGQLLVGEAEAGRMQPESLPALWAALVDAYAAGLADEGLDVDPQTVRRGAMTSLTGRTLLGAFPFERTDEPVTPELVELLRRRAGLGRFLLDLVAQAGRPAA